MGIEMITRIVVVITLVSIPIDMFLLKRNSFQNNRREVLKRRNISQGIQTRESAMMEALRNGEIKCHILPNSAPEYKVEEWVVHMVQFVDKPICKQLFSLKGYDIDG